MTANSNYTIYVGRCDSDVDGKSVSLVLDPATVLSLMHGLQVVTEGASVVLVTSINGKHLYLDQRLDQGM